MKPRSRRWLHITNQGKWYVAFTIILGVAAISSGNNVLYLLESLLLGGMALSGVLSERSVSGVEVTWKRKPVIAGEKVLDRIQVRNRTRMPIFCLEIGEWRDDKFQARAFLPYLPAKGVEFLEVSQIYPARGEYRWEGVSTATLYPFGFAKKLRWNVEPGSRLVWPTRIKKGSSALGAGKKASDAFFAGSALRNQGYAGERRGPGEFAEGEIRPIQAGDDYRDVVWTLSLKRGEPVVRPRHQVEQGGEVVLDLRQDAGPEFEKKISEAADTFYKLGDGVLTLIDHQGKRRVEGSRACLDTLACVQAAGRAA